MSVCSDDTDVLVLLPPDLFVVHDENEYSFENTSLCVVTHVGQIEETVDAYDCGDQPETMRRYGSADRLTPSARSSIRPRSLQNTPLKNLLTSESYMIQRQQDEMCLREIDEYFKERNGGSDAEPVVPTLDLPQVQEFITKMEETERDITTKNSERSCNSTMRRALNFDSPSKRDNFSQLSIQTEDTNREQLVSLNNLWTGNPKTTIYEELKVLKQRLEEERMRRQHCEDLIRDLQKQLLESREKVAVACKVDEDKDSAIKRLREGWARASEQWKECDTEKNKLVKKLSDEQQRFEQEKEVLSTNLKRYENELLKALDLVHDYKEEHKTALKDKDIIANELSAVQDQLRESEELARGLEEKIKEKDDIIDKNRVRMNELSSLCKDLKRQLKSVQNDRDKVTLEKEAKTVIQKKLDEALKREEILQEQLKTAAKNKTDLKSFYQDQVENLVMEKQKDFQMQLANAEKALNKQMEARERALMDAANNEKLQIIEKHKLEVAVLESTHKEELELSQIKITQCHAKIEDLEKKLVDQKDRQQELAEKLYTVVQNQWKETLKIISNHYCHSEDKNAAKPPTLKRQNTFTKEGEEEAEADKGVRRTGTVTYRVNETPQKISPPQQQQPLKDYIEQLLQRGNYFDDSHNSLDGKLHSTQNSVHDASSSSLKEKGKSRSPWKG